MSARPSRLAVALPPELDWKTNALMVLEALSRVWGGSGDVLFPLYDDGIPDAVIRSLKAFDADAFGVYAETFAAWRRTAPSEFEEWLERTAKQFADQGSTNSLDEWRRKLVDDHTLSRQRRHWNPDKTMGPRILETMSPLHVTDRVFADAVVMDWVPGHKFVDMMLLEPVTNAPLFTCDATDFDEDVQLLMAARVGLIGARHRKELAERNISWVEHPLAATELIPALEYAWTGVGSFARRTELQTLDGIESTPFGRTQAGCAWFGRETWPPQPFVFVVGDSCDDFAFALALDRVTRSGGWIPARLLGSSDEEHLLRALNVTIGNITRFGTEERKVLLCSLSMDTERLAELPGAIAHAGFSPDAAEWVSISHADDAELSPPWRLWDRNVNQRASSEAFVEGIQAGSMQTPLASISTPERGASVGWMVDADIVGYRLPSRGCLEGLTSMNRPFERMIRPGRDGISYFSLGGLVESRLPLELNLSRPRLRMSTGMEVFAVLLEKGGLRGEESAAGLFAHQTLDLWGSLDRFGEALSNSAERAMLTAYLSTAPSEVKPGVYLDAVRRRFLTFANLASVTGLSDSELRPLLDDWLTRRVLRRGLVLQCPACRFSGWYAIEDVGQVFRCLRCRRESELLARTWKAPGDEPGWFYDLAETVFQAMASNIEGPIRTLNALKTDSTSFDFTHEMDIFDAATNEHLGELDIWVIRDGKIVVGEVTTSGNFAGRLESKLAVLHRVATAVAADTVVFATTSAEWDGNVIDIAHAALGDVPVRLQFLASV